LIGYRPFIHAAIGVHEINKFAISGVDPPDRQNAITRPIWICRVFASADARDVSAPQLWLYFYARQQRKQQPERHP